MALAATALTLTSLPSAAVAAPTADGGNGRLGRVADRALARAQAVFSGLAAGAGSERGSGADPTIALRDLRVSYRYLSASEQQQADALLDRPYDGGSVVCGTHVCVHYRSGDGTLAEANATLTTMESVWTYEVTRLGYRAPASDGSVGGTVGGASRFDVYLSDLGDLGIYGYCAPEYYVSGQAHRATAYCALDDDFAEFPLPGDPSRRVTAAHEFFHAIQFNYDFNEDPWLLEATAVWMEDQYADDVNDNRQYLPLGQLRQPGTPLDLYDTSKLNYYGNWILFQRLSQTYGQSAVRSIWQLLDGNTGAANDYSVEGINAFLRSRGARLRTFYADFAAGNLTPASVYAEGSAYPAGRAAKTWTISQRKRTRTATARLAHLTSRSWTVKPGAGLRGHWRLRIVLDGPNRSTGAGAFVEVVSKSGAVQRKKVFLTKRGNRTVRVDFNRRTISRVYVTTTNAGISYRCNTGTSYACSGTPLSDGKAWKVRVQAVRGGS